MSESTINTLGKLDLEVSGVTESVTEDNLEKKITEICSEINVNIGEADIAACNWMPVRPKSSLQKKKKKKRQ